MRLFSKFFLKYFVISIPVYVLVIVLTNKYESRRYDNQIAALTDHVEHELIASATHFESDLNSMCADILLLTDGLDYSRLSEPLIFKQISNAYLELSRISRKFDQIRFLDTTGQEIIRVNLTENGPALVEKENLQNKADRYYVGELLKAGKNELYISPLELKEEQGKIEVPYTPVILLGMPVFDHSTRLGMVVINYLAQPLLNQILSYNNCQAMLLNQDGYWLKTEDERDEWGFQLDTDRSFKNRYPLAWQEISKKTTGKVVTPNGVFLFTVIHPFSQTADWHAQTNIQSPRWVLCHQIPPAKLDAIKAKLNADGLLNILAICSGLFIMLAMLAFTKVRTLQTGIAIQKSERAYHDLFEHMISGFALHEMIFNEDGNPTDFRFLKVNKALEDLLCLNTQEIVGHTAKEVLPNIDDLWTERYGAVLTSGQPCRFETFSKDLEKYFEVSAYKVSDGQFATIIRDVTLSHHARKAIEKKTKELQSIFDTTGAGLVLSDPESKIQDVNPAFETIFGYSRGEVIGRSYLSLIPESFQAAAQERLERLKTGETIDNAEGAAVTKSGQIITIALNEHLVFDEDHNITQIVISAMDITARKEMEAKLLANEQRYRFLSNASHEGVILCQNGKIIEANQRFFQLTGKTEADLKEGLLLESVIDPAVLQSEETVTVELRNPAMPEAIAAEVSLMHHEFNSELVDVLVIRDVSAQKKTEEMLVLAKMRAEAASRSKSEFLTTMSHELRTPMNGVMGMTQLLQDTPLNEAQREYTETIYDSSRSLLEIINNLLDLAGIEHGKVTLIKAPFNLRETALQVMEILSPEAHQKEIELAFTYDPGLPQVFMGDEGRIRQILLNLTGNAIKFSDTGCVRLAINTEAIAEEGTLVRIEISDTGIGIPQDKLDVIFDKFTQVDQSDTRRYEGTGLGLNITRRLVELMDGSLSCESIINQGSTFTVILPLTHVTEAPAAVKSHHIQTLPRPLKVLLAEDNITNQMTAEHLLHKMGCTTVNAVNGKEALDLAIQEEFDLILMDIKMPEMNGLEASVRLRAAGINTPIIAITAHAMESDRQTCIAAGMNDYLAKPIAQETLFNALNKIATA